jgi:hypothetical protein
MDSCYRDGQLLLRWTVATAMDTCYRDGHLLPRWTVATVMDSCYRDGQLLPRGVLCRWLRGDCILQFVDCAIGLNCPRVADSVRRVQFLQFNVRTVI